MTWHCPKCFDESVCQRNDCLTSPLLHNAKIKWPVGRCIKWKSYKAEILGYKILPDFKNYYELRIKWLNGNSTNSFGQLNPRSQNVKLVKENE